MDTISSFDTFLCSTPLVFRQSLSQPFIPAFLYWPGDSVDYRINFADGFMKFRNNY